MLNSCSFFGIKLDPTKSVSSEVLGELLCHPEIASEIIRVPTFPLKYRFKESSIWFGLHALQEFFFQRNTNPVNTLSRNIGLVNIFKKITKPEISRVSYNLDLFDEDSNGRLMGESRTT